MAGALTLFVPGLAAGRDGDDSAALPTLRSLLAHARHAGTPKLDPRLRQRQLLDPSASITEPPAELMREGDAISAPARHWLRADPVCLQPDRSTLRLLTAESLALDAAEADALIALLNAELGSPGWQLYRGRSERRWYLGLDAPVNATAPAPEVVARSDYDRSLPAGADAMRQRRWLNDAQMVLHAAPSNAAREQRGALPINSIWLWGGDAAPVAADRGATAPQRVFANDPLSRALATRLGRDCLPLPDATTLRAELRARRGGPVLLVVVPDAELTQSPLSYLASLAATLRALLREGVCDQVIIETEHERWTLGRFDALCFWRRRQPEFAHD